MSNANFVMVEIEKLQSFVTNSSAYRSNSNLAEFQVTDVRYSFFDEFLTNTDTYFMNYNGTMQSILVDQFFSSISSSLYFLLLFFVLFSST